MSEASPVREPVPISVGLLSRGSIVGAVVVLAVVLSYAVVLPLVDNAVEGDNPFKVGEPFVVAESYRITPQPGWALEDANELFTTISRAGATLILTGAIEAEPIEEALQPTLDAFAADTTNTWLVGETQTFVTNAGDHGVKVVAHGTDSAQESWVITDGDQNITAVASSPEAVWKNVAGELDAMVSSIVFGVGEGR